MTSLDDWYQRLLNSPKPAQYPSSKELIAFAGSPTADDNSQRSIVGLIEPGWLNPLFLPEGGYSQAIYDHFRDLPKNVDESLQSLHSKVQGINNNFSLYSFVLVANQDGSKRNGSRNHWAAMHTLSDEQLTGSDQLKFYSSKGTLYSYDSKIFPDKLSLGSGFSEFTLDILAARTYNQHAHIAIFIVPLTVDATADGGAIDLPDFRQAPFAAEASDLPLVVSASYLGDSSMSQQTTGSARSYWPSKTIVPPLYNRIDNTGLVLTISAGDKYSGLNFSSSEIGQKPLYFNHQPSSSSVFLTVGGSSLTLKKESGNTTISGAKAWRESDSTAKEGGDGGFAPATPIPDSQRTSPWIAWFQSSYLNKSLADAWTQPVTGGTLLSWWDSKGSLLELQDESVSVRELKFYDASNLTKGLNISPTKQRHLPDLSNLASPSDFISFVLNGDADLSTEGWTQAVVWNGDGGTSLASPATAAIIAAANARRRRYGMADLSASELQYMLYQIPPGILTDVTSLQNAPAATVRGYDAYPGYDFASGLGSVGNTGTISLIDYLSTNLLATMPQGSSGAGDFAFKPSRMPILLQSLQGESRPLQLLALNGPAVAALLEEEASDPTSLQTRFLETLRAAAERTRGQANPVEFTLVPLRSGWSAAAPGSILRRPISEFLQAEGVAINPESLLDLGSLPDRYPSTATAAFTSSPAYYSLLVGDPDHAPRPLRIRPFTPNRGALLGQGGSLVADGSDQRASLLLSPLQRPLLVADVAEAMNTPVQGASLQLWLAGSSQAANLYGLYPVLDASGSLSDAQGNPVKPGEGGYAALAIQAAFGDGSASLLWEVPQAGATTIRNTSRWSVPGVSEPGVSLLQATQPGALYQHLIVTLPAPEERQALIGRLINNSLSSDDLGRISVASGSANGDTPSRAVGLREAGAFMSLGFEDGAALGDRDFNDVVASWSVQDVMAQIGSLCLVDTNADRVVEVAAGSQSGTVSTVVIVSTDNSLTLQIWQPFGASDTSGVVVGSGDVNGDGFDDVVAVRAELPTTSPASTGAEVAVLLGGNEYRNPAPSAPLPTPKVLSLQASAELGSGPLSLAVRDLNADGYAEILLTAATGSAGRSSVPLEAWSRASGTFQKQHGLTIPASANLDPSHGYSLAVGDLQGDGQAEVVLGDQSGPNLFVGSVQLGATGQSFSFSNSVVLQPYGATFSSDIQPTVISAQQTITQRPAGLASDTLPWALSLPTGVAAGPTQPLLGGLGTAGALVIMSRHASDPNPGQVPLSSLSSGNSSVDLVSIPWNNQAGSPIFASGGVTYPQPVDKQMSTGIPGSPSAVLVAATAGTTSIELLSNPITAGSSAWAPISASNNSLEFSLPASTTGSTRVQQDWKNTWSAPPNTDSNRDIYGMATTDVISYTPPFEVNLNPLNLASPETLLADLSGHIEDYIQKVVIPWDKGESTKENTSPWGPGAPNSSNFPYGRADSNNLPNFKPDFTPVSNTSSTTAPSLVQQFQQRLVSAALSNMGINYQHHYSPIWYSPASWTSSQETTPQLNFQPAPPGRQTQGIDCTNFSSWYYNLAFGFWLNSETSAQSVQSSVEVPWLPGTTIEPYQVLDASTIYNDNPDDESLLAKLNQTLQPGDILYLRPSSPPNATTASHAVMWLNDNSEGSTFRFVSLPEGASTAAGGSTTPPAFVLDSTGSESANYLNQNYPDGVQIRQFDSNIWYFRNILSVQRWLTPANVQTLNPQLPSLAISSSTPSQSEGSIGSTPYSFLISRSGDLSASSSVSWSVTGSGSQAAGALDFVGNQLPSGVANFAPGQATVSIQVNVVGDRMFEADESFTTALSNPQGGRLAINSAAVTSQILNDDSQGVSYTLTATPTVVYEAGSLRIGVDTTNVAAGTRLFWKLSGVGITSADLVDGQLSGSTTIGADGRSALSLAVAADAVGDAGEQLVVRFYRDASGQTPVGNSISITIQEPSVGIPTDGNDIIIGTAAAETLTGIPTSSSLRGRNSFDVLTGSSGADLFMLGDQFGPYYNDGTPALGTPDMALITDFQPGDRIQLFGNSSLYSLVQSFHAGVPGLRITLRNGALLPLPGGAGSTPLVGNEAIGFIQGATLASLNLSNSTQFIYLS